MSSWSRIVGGLIFLGVVACSILLGCDVGRQMALAQREVKPPPRPVLISMDERTLVYRSDAGTHWVFYTNSTNAGTHSASAPFVVKKEANE